MNSRFLPMGIALAPSLPGGALQRAAQGQTVVDASWAMANDGGGRFDRHFLFGASSVQYVDMARRDRARRVRRRARSAIRAISASTRSSRRSSSRCCFPSCATRASRGVALAGALIALALVPLAPPGVPVLAASAAALVGLKRQHARAAAR